MAEFQVTFFLDSGLTVEATIKGDSYDAVANDMAYRLRDDSPDVLALYQAPHVTLVRVKQVRYCTVIPLGAEGERYTEWYAKRNTDLLMG